MNYILINPDEMRHDALGCYGNPAAVTPNMDRLAAQGTRFENCFVQNSVCTPSRCSFLTGLYPHNRGHRTLWNTLQPDEPSIFSYLKEAGYQVHLWGKNDAFAPETLDKVATSINQDIRGDGYALSEGRIHKAGEKGFQSFLYKDVAESVEESSDYDYFRNAIRYLESKPKDPFCLFIAASAPHPPYKNYKEFIDAIDLDKVPALKPYVEGKADFHDLIRQYRDLDQLEEGDFKEIMKVYLGMTSMVDFMVGRLLKAVDDNGLRDNTAIILFSDHGDYAGDYGLVEKWPSGMDDVLLHIPLILRVPGFPEGIISKGPVEAFDIVATLLELSGITADHSHFSRSLTPQLSGVEQDLNRTVFAEGGYDDHERHAFEGSGLAYDITAEDPNHIYQPKVLMQQEIPESVCRSVMARNMDAKLIRRSSGKHEFYDLKADPDELNNLYKNSDYTAEIHTMETELLDWYLRTSDTVPFKRQMRGYAKQGIL